MAPRSQTLRPAQTASAREAMRAFFCELCQKGYSRMNEYEAHLSSYDHSHKQRLKDMKAMVRDPTAAARARRQEAKATDAVISIKLGGGESSSSNSINNPSGDAAGSNSGSGAGIGFRKGGFRKGGFKSAFTPVDTANQPKGEPTAAASPAASAAAAPGQMIPPITLPGSSSSASGPSVPSLPATIPPPLPLVRAGRNDPASNPYYESDTEDEGYEVYDPRKPTD